MCKVMEDLREESIQRGIAQGIDQSRSESIRNLMTKLKISGQEAMELLGIPADEQAKYRSMG